MKESVKRHMQQPIRSDQLAAPVTFNDHHEKAHRLGQDHDHHSLGDDAEGITYHTGGGLNHRHDEKGTQ